MIKITAKRDGDGVAIFCNGKKYVRETAESAIRCAEELYISAAVTNATELINKAMKFDEVVNV